MKKVFFLLLWVLLLFQACKPREIKTGLSKHPLGYWWQLLAFSSDSLRYNGDVAWVEAVFSNQKDSVFFDSKHELFDRFFIHSDTLQTANFLEHRVSRCCEGDSVQLLINTKDFFEQQFKSRVPFFSRKDSVVKVRLKIKKRLSPEAWKAFAEKIKQDESAEIEKFFGSEAAAKKALDASGFYWVSLPEPEMPNGNTVSEEAAKYPVIVNISYSGTFLDGRFVDIAPLGFQFTYGTPDQVLKGLNIVIGKLKPGQNSKIILPSHLAFGESGSSNGSIPPFTPMLYEIKVNDIKN